MQVGVSPTWHLTAHQHPQPDTQHTRQRNHTTQLGATHPRTNLPTMHRRRRHSHRTGDLHQGQPQIHTPLTQRTQCAHRIGRPRLDIQHTARELADTHTQRIREPHRRTQPQRRHGTHPSLQIGHIMSRPTHTRTKLGLRQPHIPAQHTQTVALLTPFTHRRHLPISSSCHDLPFFHTPITILQVRKCTAITIPPSALSAKKTQTELRLCQSCARCD